MTEIPAHRHAVTARSAEPTEIKGGAVAKKAPAKKKPAAKKKAPGAPPPAAQQSAPDPAHNPGE